MRAGGARCAGWFLLTLRAEQSWQHSAMRRLLWRYGGCIAASTAAFLGSSRTYPARPLLLPRIATTCALLPLASYL